MNSPLGFGPAGGIQATTFGLAAGMRATGTSIESRPSSGFAPASASLRASHSAARFPSSERKERPLNSSEEKSTRFARIRAGSMVGKTLAGSSATAVAAHSAEQRSERKGARILRESPMQEG